MSGPPAVRLDGITKRFPGVVANDDVDLTVERGTVHALLGENGAGKTTLMNVLYGLMDQTAGKVYVDGDGLPVDGDGRVRTPERSTGSEPTDVARPREFDSPRDAIDAGVGMIHQHFMLVDPMTVTENITLGNEPRKWAGLSIDREEARAAVVDLRERYGFDVDPDAVIEDLGVGVQQRVEILKALYRGADVLILDEPTAVLTPQEVSDLFDVFEELTSAGKTIIFITHKLGEAMAAADEITVLRDGRNVGTVQAESTSREELAELMVGREVLLETTTAPVDVGEEVLRVDGLVAEDDRGVRAVDGVSLAVREGEVFGVAGVDGNGQSELVEALTGLRNAEAGEVRIRGADVTDASRRARIRQGMAYVPEDRQERGLVMSFDLVENGILGTQHDPPFERGGRIDWGRARDYAETVIERFDVRPPEARTAAASLSGGNQQKFVVGRELSRDPEILIASHPTRGVDVGSIEFIHERLLELRRAGKAVLLVSSKLEEVRELSDRVGVMYDGELIDVVDPGTVTEEQLGLLMAGEHPQGMDPSDGPERPASATVGEKDPEAEVTEDD